MTSPARVLRDVIEPFHAHTYFSPELRDHYVDDLGLHPWAAYFASRAAAMGRVSTATATAIFFSFSPRLLGRTIPSVWDVITPEAAVTHRHEAVARSLRRLLTDFDPSTVAEATRLAEIAIGACEFAGRPLAAAHAATPRPDDALAGLWHQLAILREYRGDGHVAALVGAGLGPVDSLVTSTGYGDLSLSRYRRLRGWSDEAWEQAIERCHINGWVNPDASLTAHGRAMRDHVEEVTDRSMRAPLAALGPDRTARLTEIMAGFSAPLLGLIA